MKDLDFDELDRAVNSLMTNVPNAVPPPSDDGVKTLTPTPASEEDKKTDEKKADDEGFSQHFTPSSAVKPAASPMSVPTSSVHSADESHKDHDPLLLEPTASPDAEPATSPVAPVLAEPVVATPPVVVVPTSRIANTTPSVAARRAGRFMDVVHPSSDMTKVPSPTQVAGSRQGVTIAPPPQAAGVAEKPKVEDAPKPSILPEDSVASSEIETTHPAGVSEWPDPLDMMGDFDAKTDHDTDTNTTEDVTKSDMDKLPSISDKEDIVPAALVVEEEEPSDPLKAVELDKDDAETEQEKPLSTPFLAGAKVEKRPLGSGAAPAEEPTHAPVLFTQSDEADAVHSPNDQLPANPKDVEPVLPAELQQDLVAIESDTTHAGLPKTDATHPADSVPEKKPMPSSYSVKEEKTESTGPTSIPQQYREEPSTGDQANGAIYDTDTYHQPVEHPDKKGSGWMWVIWILVILLIGAGGGAALYFLGIV